MLRSSCRGLMRSMTPKASARENSQLVRVRNLSILIVDYSTVFIFFRG